MAFEAQQKRQAFGGIVIVVDYQNPEGLLPARDCLDRWAPDLGLARGFLPGQVHQKFRAASRAATANFHVAPMLFNQALDYRQPDAQADLGSGEGVIGSSKKVENIGQHVRRYTYTVILNAKSDPLLSGFDTQLDAPAHIRIFGGIVEQIRDHLG